MATPRNMESPNSRRNKSRRSWFDAPPLTTLDPQEISRQPRPKKLSPDSVESLTLTHFTSAPRLSFGKVIVGNTKYRHILIRNPHDYEQEVVVEKFPFKKKFSTEHTRFIVYPNDVFDLEISWMPQDETSVREMILFHVNDVFRLQAYVFGTSEKRKPPRKVRKGILGPRVMQPISVLQTPALSRIKSSYDRASLESPVYSGVSKLGEIREPVQETEDLLRHHPSSPKEVTVKEYQENPRLKENVENLKPGEDICYTPFPLESTSVEIKLDGDENQSQCKRMSAKTSPTLNTMSPIPVIDDVEKGFIVDSYFKSNDTLVDPSQAVDRKPTFGDNILKGTFLCQETLTKGELTHCTASGTVLGPRPSDAIRISSGCGRKEQEAKVENVSPSLMHIEKDQLQSFAQTNMSNNIELKMRVNWSSPQLTSDCSTVCQPAVSPNTRLNQSLNLISQMSTPLRGTHFSPHDSDSSVNASIISQGHGLVSPNSFMEDMKTFQKGSGRKRKITGDIFSPSDSLEGRNVEVPSPSRILDNSIPHDIMVEHLQKIQSSLHTSGSFITTRSPLKASKPRTKRRSITSMFRQKEKQRVSSADVSANKRPSTKGSGGDADKSKFNTKQIQRIRYGSNSLATCSPRRGTFLVTKKSPNGRSAIQKKISPFRGQGRPGKARKSPGNKKSFVNSKGKGEHSSIQEADAAIAKIKKVTSLQSAPYANCQTPPTRRTSCVDDRTVVKSSSFVNVGADKLSVDEVMEDDNVKASKRKTLFPSEIQGALEEIERPMKEANETSGFVVEGKGMTNSVVFAIDRKEIFVDKAGNVISKSITNMRETSPQCGTIIKNGQLISIRADIKDDVQTVEETERRDRGGLSPEFHTPTMNLPEKPDPSLSRRSTKVIWSPKVICVATMQQRCLNFDSAVNQDINCSSRENISTHHQSANDSNIQPCITQQHEELMSTSDNQNTTSVIKIMSPVSSLHSSIVGNGSTLLATNNCLSGSRISESDSLTTDSLETSHASSPSDRNGSSPSKMLASECSSNDQEEQIIHTNEQSQIVGVILSGQTGISTGMQSASKLSRIEDEETDSLETSHASNPADRNCSSPSKMLATECSTNDQEERIIEETLSGQTGTSTDMLSASRLSKVEDKKVGIELDIIDDVFAKPVERTKNGAKNKLQRRSVSTSSLPPSSKDNKSLRNSLQPKEHSGHHHDDCLFTCTTSKSESAAEVLSPSRPSSSIDLRSCEQQRGSIPAASIPHQAPSNSRNEGVKSFVRSRTGSNQNHVSCPDGRLRATDKSESRSRLQTNDKGLSSICGAVPPRKPGLDSRSRSVDCLDSKVAGRNCRDGSVKLPTRSQGSQHEARRGKFAGDSNRKKTASTAKSVAKPSKCVAQSKLILMRKTSKTALPKHPMPFAARNMYYDERWMEKQERGFVQWLNFVLTPPDEYVAVSKHSKIDAGSLALSSHQVAPRLAPTKEILSFRAYAARRRLNRLRRAACELYHSEKFVSVIHKVEIEVESRRLVVRKEKMIHADLGIRQKLLDLLMQYSSLWLRVGLETVFGEMLLLQSNTDIMGLSRFIVTRLLGSPDIGKEYAHATVPHLYKDGFAEALSRHSLKKFLLLVYFLDQAKSARLIDHDPCLFYKDAAIKSSKEVLVEFSREILSGEGDLIRHLAYLGYIVSHKQNPIDEFDYAVTNLSTDLKDGLRLSRVVELLASDTGTMGKLRAPAISRLQKIHNMDVFFNVMKKHDLDFVTNQGITPRDVVNGHREKTLSLLWHLILHFQANIQVNEEHLQEEINLLTKSLQLKLAMQKIGVLKYQDSLARRDSGDGQCLQLSNRMQLIFRWCQLVCLHYGIKIENLTVSFSDGRAFCCLLHHYHPVLLPQSEINFETTLSFQADAEALCDEEDPDLSRNCSGYNSGLLQSEADPVVFRRLLSNEKANFKTLYEKVSALGGVPLMVKSTDMSNTIPDEKVVSTYVAYLCARLLDIRQEVKAARVIQMAWRRRKLHRDFRIRQKAVRIIQRNFRKYLLRKRAWEMKLMEERNREMEKAAIIIQRYFRSSKAQRKFFSYRKSALIIQSLWRKRRAMKLAKKEVEERRALRAAENHRKAERSALIIQKHVRGWFNRKKLHKETKSAVCIQKWWRGYLAKLHTAALRSEKQNRSATVIQKWVRGMICRKTYQRLRIHVLLIQTHWRMIKIQRHFKLVMKERNAACLLIQRIWKGRVCLLQFQSMKKSAVCVQSHWRGYVTRKRTKALREEKRNEASRIIQRSFHSFLIRKSFLRKRRAAITIQSHWRNFLLRREEKRKRLLEVEEQRKRTQAVVLIQKNVRGWLLRRNLQNEIKSAICIQKWWRGYSARKLAIVLRRDLHSRCAVVIQKWVRRRICMKIFHRSKAGALLLQTQWRRVLAQRYFQGLLAERTKAAVIIQKLYRAKVCSKQFAEMKKSAICIQSCWRCYKARLCANELRLSRCERAATIIQKTWRAYCMNKRFCKMKTGALVVQKYCRRWLAQKRMHCLMEERRETAALRIQKNARMWISREKFLSLKRATLKVQSRWRMKQAVQQLDCLKSERNARCATRIQTAWRRYRCRKGFLDRKSASVAIQASWRMHSQKKRFRQQKSAAIIIQRRVKATLLSKRGRAQYLRLKSSVIYIQSLVRRRAALRDFSSKKKAVIVIQSLFRMYKRRMKYLAVRLAAVIVQRAYRNYCHGRRVREEYLTMVQSVIVLQRSYRQHLRHKELKQEASAITLQAAVRGFLAFRKFQKQKEAVETIQSKFRAVQTMKMARKEYVHRRNATITIQSFFRMHLAQKHLHHLKKTYIRKQEAATRIQSFFKGYMVHKEYKRWRNAVVVLQRWFRSVRTMKRERGDFVSLRSSVVRIQSLCRMHLTRKAYREKCNAVIRLQAFARRLKAENHFHITRNAALVLQFYYRAWKKGKFHRSQFVALRHAAIVIQQSYRRRLLIRETRKSFLMRNNAATKIQSFYKARRQRKEYVSLVTSVICMQRRFRAIMQGRLVRIKMQEELSASKIIQRGWRRFYFKQKALEICQKRRLEIEERRYQRAEEERVVRCRRHAAHVIQRAFRRFLSKKHEQKVMAATVIQAFVRRFLRRRNYLRLHQSVTCIQAHWRGYRCRQEFRAFKEKHDAARMLQARVRGYLTRKRILPFLNARFQEQRERRLREKSATKIQALWRGFVVRRNNTNKRLQRARKRVEDVNRSATEEKTLGYRTSSALDFLFKDKDLSYILEALMHLEVATRLSPLCCERVVEVNAIAVLFHLIGSCNRSVPHMEIIKYSIDVILNLAKYQQTVDAILVVPEATAILLDLLQIYREKGIIFLKTCQLLSILATDPHRKQVIMACERIEERLQSIHSLVLRKHRSQQAHQVVKAKMVAMKSFNSTLPLSSHLATPSKRHHFSPEWNLGRKKSKEFDSPLTAISCVLNVLRIGPK